ncbi:MAG: tetratricopeptide repeat protein [Spirochaetes bacterium]|nr:tetratricopeptide repeat protein [Spirochaetota bacterium]
MKRSVLSIAMAAMLLGGCVSYRSLTVERRHYMGPLPSRESGGADEDPGAGWKPFTRTTVVVRYLALVRERTPVAAINNRAVFLALGGRYEPARILFQEALGEGGETPAVLNNLGVARELTGDRAGAIDLYAGACRLDPGNRHFIHNFQTGVDYRPGEGW